MALATHLEDGEQNSLDILLEAIVASLPVEMIYSDCSTHLKDVQQSRIAADEVIDKLEALTGVLFNGGKADVESFREVVKSTQFFADRTDMVEQFIKEKLA